MSAGTQKYVDSLLLQFRELVIDIQEEQRELLEKLNEFPEPLTLASTLTTNNIAKSNTNSNTTNTNSKSTTYSGSASPPSEEPNSNSTALSSSIATTNDSNRPPSYKTAVKPDDHQQVPRPPLRSKKRSATLATSTVPPHHTSLANAAAAAALARVSRISRGFNTISSPPATTMRGALIVLEGLDRVGKSTLTKKLVEHLQRINKPVATCRFPDRSTKVGQLIDDLLKNTSKQIDDHVMHLLFSANRWELNKTIRHTVNKGTTVIIDRYAYSGMAYSSAKRSLSMDWCLSTERGLPKPDLVIYLELPKESQYQRPGFGEERFETREFQELIRQQYEQIISTSQETWLRVDVANKSPDEVLGEIIMPVKRCLESCENKDLEDLI